VQSDIGSRASEISKARMRPRVARAIAGAAAGTAAIARDRQKKSLVWDQALKAPLKEETGECSD